MKYALALCALLAAAPALAQSSDWQAATAAKLAAPVDAPALRGDAVAAPPPLRAASPVAEPAAIMVPSDTPAPAAFAPAPAVIKTMSFAGGVTAQFDIAWRAPLTLDLYRPATTGRAVPLVVFLHGGDWNGGDARRSDSMTDLPQNLAAIAARGFAVASVNYRAAGAARFPGAVQDVKAAIRWLRRQASAYGIDATRVAVWGEGAGGHLAALVGTSCGVALFDSAEAGPGSDCVQAVIDWYGPVELGPEAEAAPATPVSMPTSKEGVFLGCEPKNCAPGLVRQASPLTFISEVSPPFLILQGADDPLLAQSQKLLAALKDRGVPAELVTYPETGHNFLKAGTPDPETLRAALDRTAAFLGQVFPVSPLRTARPRQRGSLN